MHRKLFFIFALAPILGGSAVAGTVSYQVSVDTSLVSGTPGGIYLDFSPGSDVTEIDVSGFNPLGGLSGGPSFTDGGVSGTLDTNDLVFTPQYATNDYGEALTFSATLSFNVTFSAPVVGSTGSEFDIELTQSDLVTPILSDDLTTANDVIADFTTDGSGNFTTYATADATITLNSSTPEPNTGVTFALLAAFGMIGAATRKRPVGVKLNKVQ
jgi:hypothetical protein